MKSARQVSKKHVQVMRALTADPQLWFGYNERPNEELYDKLLFRKEDFDAPHESQLFQDLRRSSDEKVRNWADELFGLYRVPIQDVPPLDQFVCDFEKVRDHYFKTTDAYIRRDDADIDPEPTALPLLAGVFVFGGVNDMLSSFDLSKFSLLWASGSAPSPR